MGISRVTRVTHPTVAVGGMGWIPRKNMPDHLKGMMINHDKPVDFLMLYVQTNPAAKRMKVVKRATQSGSYLKTDAFKNMLASITRGKKALNGSS